MSYKSEFGSDFDLGFNLSDYPYLTDKSWHNDVSPSFYFNVAQQYYVLWADYAEQHKREGASYRYLIQEAENEGNNAFPEIYSSDGDIIFEIELPFELKQTLKGLVTDNPCCVHDLETEN